MSKVLYIILISIFSLTIISCSSSSDGGSSTTSTTTDDDNSTSTDTTAPVISGCEITTPTNDNTPDFIITSSEAGTVTFGGSCSSSTTSVTSGTNTITFNTLSDGVYSDCTCRVTDSAGNVSSTLTLSSFSGIEQMGGSFQGVELSLSTVVTILAGTGSSGSANGTGTSASFNVPMGITNDGTNLYVSDTDNHLIRQIVISTGVVTTVAGTGSSGSANGTGTSASFNGP